jgi:DNA-binding response OmpR family regulator
MSVLVCSPDPVLSALLARNLERRGFETSRQPGPVAAVSPAAALMAAAVLVDLDADGPADWDGAARARTAWPGVPVVFLSHDWPTSARLAALRPCVHLPKPLAVGVLLEALRDLGVPSPTPR